MNLKHQLLLAILDAAIVGVNGLLQSLCDGARIEVEGVVSLECTVDEEITVTTDELNVIP